MGIPMFQRMTDRASQRAWSVQRSVIIHAWNAKCKFSACQGSEESMGRAQQTSCENSKHSDAVRRPSRRVFTREILQNYPTAGRLKIA